MADEKITLFKMAEEIEQTAQIARLHVEIWDRDHAQPLPDSHHLVQRALALEAAALVLALMSQDEAGARKYVAGLMATPEGRQLRLLMASRPRKAFHDDEAAA